MGSIGAKDRKQPVTVKWDPDTQLLSFIGSNDDLPVAGFSNSSGQVYSGNSAGVIVFQPSSDPSAGTEAVQVKNSAGVVQSALSFDGRFYAADGLVGTPGFSFENDKDSGLYRVGANDIALVVNGAQMLHIDSTGRMSVFQIISTTTATDLVLDLASNRDLIIKNNGTETVRVVGASPGVINYTQTTHTVTGTAATLAGIGNGPGGAAQTGWLTIQVNGSARYLPYWT